MMAEKYFDDMNNDVQITGKRHQQRSVDGYDKLPKIFSYEDIKKCFGYNNDSSVYSKISRLKEQRLVIKIDQGENKGKFQKINQGML